MTSARLRPSDGHDDRRPACPCARSPPPPPAGGAASPAPGGAARRCTEITATDGAARRSIPATWPLSAPPRGHLQDSRCTGRAPVARARRPGTLPRLPPPGPASTNARLAVVQAADQRVRARPRPMFRRPQHGQNVARAPDLKLVALHGRSGRGRGAADRLQRRPARLPGARRPRCPRPARPRCRRQAAPGRRRCCRPPATPGPADPSTGHPAAAASVRPHRPRRRAARRPAGPSCPSGARIRVQSPSPTSRKATTSLRAPGRGCAVPRRRDAQDARRSGPAATQGQRWHSAVPQQCAAHRRRSPDLLSRLSAKARRFAGVFQFSAIIALVRSTTVHMPDCLWWSLVMIFTKSPRRP